VWERLAPSYESVIQMASARYEDLAVHRRVVWTLIHLFTARAHFDREPPRFEDHYDMSMTFVCGKARDDENQREVVLNESGVSFLRVERSEWCRRAISTGGMLVSLPEAPGSNIVHSGPLPPLPVWCVCGAPLRYSNLGRKPPCLG